MTMTTGGPGPSRRKSVSDSILEYVIKVVVIAVIIAIVMPLYIAPVLFHVSPEEYTANSFYFTVIAVIIAIPIAYIMARALAWGIRTSGG